MRLLSLTIYTLGYFDELRKLITENACFLCTGQGEVCGYRYVSCCFNEFGIMEIVKIMEDIIIDQNPLVKSSPKIESLVKESILRPAEIKNAFNLMKYIGGSNELVLEGYVRFMMSECNNEINVKLYSLVKKMCCFEKRK